MRETPSDAFRSALVAIVAVLLSFGATYALSTKLGADASPAVLAAALTVGLVRRAEPLDARSILSRFLMLPLIALAAGAVGYTFLKAPLLGAVLFSGGIALSVWLRQFGEMPRALGRTIALPLMTILIVPVHIGGRGASSTLLVVAAGLIAMTSSFCTSWCAARIGIQRAPQAERRPRSPRAPRDGELPIATRMALQMLVALALAFAIGMWAFPTHWPWLVLTAFIVCSGAAGRGDAIYKGLLRLGGAIGGTFAGAIVAHVTFPNGIAYAATIFAILFLGIWLRRISYAYWAACATLVFALLQGSQGANVTPLFAVRVLCIVIGALCAVAATWFVYPIRTEQVVRRRVADALGALREVLDGTHGSEASLALLDSHAEELRRLTPPVRLHRALFGAKEPDAHPTTWIDLMDRLIDRVRKPDFDRAHVGAEMRRLGAMLRNRTAGGASKDSP